MHRSSILSLSLAAALAIIGPGAARAGEHHVIISIGTDALATARATMAGDPGFEVLSVDDDVAVLSVDEPELEALTEAMHAEHGRCGGYMVHASLADALAADRPADGPPPDYRIDRPDAVRAALSAIEAPRILASIQRLSSMRNRYYRSPTGAEAAVQLRDEWRSFTARPDVTVELIDHGYAQRSVVMTIPGTTRPDEIVILGGHLDSIAAGGTRSDAPGADDDASGIATLTEVARALLAADLRPQRTIQFMAYAAEEVGLRGSLSISRAYQQRGVKVAGVLQLDMTNYQGSDKDLWLIADHTDAGQNAFLGRLIDTYVGATWAYDACGYACSDHAAWTRAGYRASMPFEARFRDSNRAIHTRNDTLERSANNVAHAVKFARLAAAYAVELADADLGSGSTAAPPAPRGATPWRALLLSAVLAALAVLAVARARRDRGTIV